VIAEGTPEDVADNPDSYTGAFLKPLLEGREAAQPKPARRTRASATTAPAAKKAPAKKAAAKRPTKKAAAKKSA
jgi:excinuclease ABC subunit A